MTQSVDLGQSKVAGAQSILPPASGLIELRSEIQRLIRLSFAVWLKHDRMARATPCHVKNMLRKIDCVMVYVEDLPAAIEYYERVFGLHRIWQDENSCGLGFPETDAEIVLHNDATLPSKVEVHYLVDDVVTAVKMLHEQGCETVVAPFDIVIGKCAVIRDPFGITLSILDMTKGPRKV